MEKNIFTITELDERELVRAPVEGCVCPYCAQTREKGYTAGGRLNPSHRLRGGDERHNPENLARLTMREMLNPEQFADYVRRPGGATFETTTASGVTYRFGRICHPAGHFIDVRVGHTHVCNLCMPTRRTHALATMVMAQHLLITADEEAAWKKGHALWMDYTDLLPENLLALAHTARPRW
jgi:hypothetical protein